jgi:hypothetical protein
LEFLMRTLFTFQPWVKRKAGDQGSGQAIADFPGFSGQMPGGGCGEAAQRSQNAPPSVPKAALPLISLNPLILAAMEATKSH